MVMDNKTLAVVIPSYKAAGTIGDVVRKIPEDVDRIIIVDDASPDDLEKIVRELSDPRIVYLRHSRNQGVGGAMVSGFRKALELGVDLIVKVDADGQMDPAYLPCFVRTAVKYDCDYVKGNRFGHIEALRTMPRLRRLGNIALSFLAKVASGCWNVFDPQNGYVMITRSMLRKLDLSRIDKGYFFEDSMLINLNIFRARIAEIYLPARYGEQISSMRLCRIVLSFPFKLLRGLMFRIYQKYVFRSVSPVFLLLAFGLPSLIFGVVWGALGWYRSIISGQVATAGTVVISLLPIVVGTMCLLEALILDVQDAGPCILVEYDDEGIGDRNPQS